MESLEVSRYHDQLKALKFPALGRFVVVCSVLQYCATVATTFYPHMPIGKVWIYRLLFIVCLFFVCLYGYGFFTLVSS